MNAPLKGLSTAQLIATGSALLDRSSDPTRLALIEAELRRRLWCPNCLADMGHNCTKRRDRSVCSTRSFSDLLVRR